MSSYAARVRPTTPVRVGPRDSRGSSSSRRNKRDHSGSVTPRTPSKRSRLASPSSDRFIPNRAGVDYDLCNYFLGSEPSGYKPSSFMMDTTAAKEEYSDTIAAALLNSPAKGKPILSFGDAPQTPLSPWQNTPPSRTDFLFSGNDPMLHRPKRRERKRKIPTTEDKILDAPDFVDDFYLNLLDWGPDNFLAVALNKSIFLWNAANGDIVELMTVEGDDIVTSLKWANGGQFLGVGTSNGEVRVYDCHTTQKIRTMKSHISRVSCLSWNGQILSSGGRDQTIVNHHVGLERAAVNSMRRHDQEVCGLEWNLEGTVLASGGNDNLLLLWDTHMARNPRHVLERHEAAVKAIAWCPHQPNLIASGGGTADRHIRFWNSATGACIGERDTKSQVCCIKWSKTYKNELVSSHGFSQNQLIVWDYPKMEKLAELTGHTSRVLQMAMSPDGETVVSVAGDETLRFWRIFERETRTKSSRGRKKPPTGIHQHMSIR